MTSGVYVIVHRPTGKFFVGGAPNIETTANQWLWKLRRGKASKPVRELRSRAGDWFYKVLHEMPCGTARQRIEIETMAERVMYACQQSHEVLLLNTYRMEDHGFDYLVTRRPRHLRSNSVSMPKRPSRMPRE